MKPILKAVFVCCLYLSFFTPIFTMGSTPVTLVKNSKSNWHIIPLSQKPEIKFAAGEFQKYVSLISNFKLPFATVQGNSPAVIIGLRADISAKYKALLPAKKRGYDGYSVVVSEKPAVILIAGDNAQGVIYGMYDMLEKFGCRWFYPADDKNDPEVLPDNPTIDIDAASWSMASPVEYRICYLEMNEPYLSGKIDWVMKNRYNMLGAGAPADTTLSKEAQQQYTQKMIAEMTKRGLTFNSPGHLLNVFLPAEKYMKDHPEWFGLRNGKRVPQTIQGAQFCWSNKWARKEAIKNAGEYLRTTPLIRVLTPSPFDGGQNCECSECKKIGASNLLMILLGEMIDELQPKYPNVAISTVGGYPPVVQPPTLENIHPKLHIVWAQWGRHMNVGYDDPAYDKTNLDAWNKAAKGGLTICQYYTDNFAEPWIMGPFTDALISDRQYFIKNKVEALYMLMFPNGYWWNHTLNGYLGGRCYYDASLNPYDEVKDYAMHYFGKDAGPLLAAYYTQWGKEIDLSYRICGGSTEKDRAMLAQQRKEWLAPATEATKNNPLYAYRVAKVEKLHTLAETLTAAHRMHDTVKSLRQESKFDEAAKVIEEAKVYTDKCIDMFYALDSLKQGLVDTQKSAGFDFVKLGIKAWILQEMELVKNKDRSVPQGPKKKTEAEMVPGETPKN